MLNNFITLRILFVSPTQLAPCSPRTLGRYSSLYCPCSFAFSEFSGWLLLLKQCAFENDFVLLGWESNPGAQLTWLVLVPLGTERCDAQLEVCGWWVWPSLRQCCTVRIACGISHFSLNKVSVECRKSRLQFYFDGSSLVTGNSSLNLWDLCGFVELEGTGTCGLWALP